MRKGSVYIEVRNEGGSLVYRDHHKLDDPIEVDALIANVKATLGDEQSDDGLDALTKAQLVELAASQELTVTRGDGGDGEPLKDDYIAALRAVGITAP